MELNANNKPLNEWSEKERISAVKKIFNTITPRYDLLNHVLSGCQDIRWRKFTTRHLPSDAKHVLDVATGTGDLAIAMARKRPSLSVTGVDFVQAMMALAISKTERAGLTSQIDFIAGDAMQLPLGENRFDAATVAFGFRNIPDRIGALREMSRVVKPGGKILVLEMTLPRGTRSSRFFKWYLKNVVPRVGRLISGNGSAYDYLSESIEDFLRPDELTSYFEKAGLVNIKTYPLTFGITYLHEGIVA
ncbi:MAG: bifunctional demethylmenaquinone methyltransferase/2-methoxy-6-polyprenyl-1,4-benzoquinol methylase UbiE [Candidatus Zixiibacteriota bacterium]